MRVFITGTGRCGTVSIATAFKHATNYKVTHELKNPKLEFPDNSIAVNPQFRVRLDLPLIYPNALFIRMNRSFDKTAMSYANLDSGNYINKWRDFYDKILTENPLDNARILVTQMNIQLDRFFELCKNKEIVNLENIKVDFVKIWNIIGAKGNLNKALEVFNTPLNTTEQRNGSANCLR